MYGDFKICGLTGVIGNVFFKEEKALKTLLVLDSLRGLDSTGVATVARGNGHVMVAKHLGDPYQLFDSRKFEDSMKGQLKAIIGHNRFATQGAVNAKNAHPFNFDTLVGAHNGTLRNKYRLLDAPKFEVDSENLYHHIEKNGLRSAMDVCEGAWALTWWDKMEGTMNFLRNKERPLWFATSEKDECLFWASEKWMLEVALPRHEIKINQLTELVVDTHLSIAVDNFGKMAKPVAREMKAKEAVVHVPFVQHQQAKWVGHSGATSTTSNQTTPSKATTGSSVTKVEDNKTASNVVDIKGKKKDGKVFYVNSKDVEFEVISLTRDTNGAEFIQLLDHEAPQHDVRLYITRNGMDEVKALTEDVGRTIIGSIKDIKLHRKEGTYYKVATHTVKIVPLESKEGEAEDAPFELVPELVDHKGRPISKEDFIQTYGECAYCTGFVDPDCSYRRFTKQDNCVCGDCATDPQLSAYMSLA